MMISRKRKGQSIIEAMIALGILTTGLLGILSLLSKSFFLSRLTSNELTATYLAEEGIELSKNMIDHAVYAGTGWDTCPAVPVGLTETFEIDYLSGTSSSTDPNPCLTVNPPLTPLKFTSATGRYGYGEAVASDFTREIRISVPSAANGNEIVVNSIVTWTTGTSPESVDLEDHFYDWHQ